MSRAWSARSCQGLHPGRSARRILARIRIRCSAGRLHRRSSERKIRAKLKGPAEPTSCSDRRAGAYFAVPACTMTAFLITPAQIRRAAPTRRNEAQPAAARIPSRVRKTKRSPSPPSSHPRGLPVAHSGGGENTSGRRTNRWLLGFLPCHLRGATRGLGFLRSLRD